MHGIFKKAISSYSELHNDYYLAILQSRIDSIDFLVSQMQKITSEYQNKLKRINKSSGDYTDLLKEHHSFLNKIQTLNKQIYLNDEESTSIKALKAFFTEADVLATELPKKIQDFETECNRVKHVNDSRLIRSIKLFKRIRFKLKSLFLKDKTLVKIKKKLPLRYYLLNELYLRGCNDFWTYIEQILLQEIELIKYFQDSFTSIDLFYQLQTNDQTDDLQQILKGLIEKCNEKKTFINNYQEQVINETQNKISAYTSSITDNYNKLGTIEGRRTKDRPYPTKRRVKKIKNRQLKQLRSWEIALYGLSEDWCFDADLLLVKSTAIGAFNSKPKFNIIESVNASIQTTNATLQKVTNLFNQVKLSDENSVLINIQKKISQAILNKNLRLSEVEHSQSALVVLNELEQHIVSQILNTNDKRNILSNNTPWEKIQLSDTTSVYLKDLLQFEIQPKFSSAIDQLKQAIQEKIVQYETELSTIMHVSEYNFDTVISIINDNDELDTDNKINDVYQEGKDKVIAKLADISTQLEAIKSLIENQLNESFQILINELLELTENEKVGELNIRLIKAKAIRQSSKLKAVINKYLSTYITNGLTQINLLKKHGFKLGKQLSKIYSQEEVQAQINNEISIFLSEIANTTEKLPFLYQRLFKLEAIDEGHLYHQRKAELTGLENTFRHWLKGRFASLAICAEKGAGVTSLINYALKNKDLPITYINFQDFIKIYQTDEFVFTLADILELTPMNEVELFIDELNAKKQIIVLEGLQFAYLKKVDGFESLKLLFEIISKTNKSIFWICTCTLHAWNYLNKAVSIEEYFGHVIKLGDFSNEELIEIIKKRHRVSGYDIQYLPDKKAEKNRKSKQNPEEIQASREKQYFQLLTTLSKGNLSVAFIFWLRSIKRIANNTLYINSMNDFNSSFIKGLSQEKLFSLYAILLHDGLDIESFCKVMRYSPEQGRMKLFQMVDDGLLLEIKGRFVINLLLYRSIIDALKARNFLH